MLAVGVGEEEDGLLKCLHLGVHLVHLDVRLELGEVVDCALSVGRGNHICGIVPDVLGDLSPRGFDSGAGVSEGAILYQESAGAEMMHQSRVQVECVPCRREQHQHQK